MPIQQICTVVSMEQLDQTTWQITLSVGRLASEHGLRGSQFLHIKCGDGQLLRRPISVAMVRRGEPEDTAVLIFEDRGQGTRWLSRRKPGDSLDVLGPLGNGFDFSRPGRYLLVGGGIGVPPLMGLGASLPWPTDAVLGFRSADKAFPAVVSRFQGHCRRTFLCTDDGSLGRQGFVDGQVREILEKDAGFTSILACGPRQMLKSVAKVAEEFGVHCQVSMEERMACGIGACLGCAIPMADGSMRRVCEDGPVFSAEEVAWDV